MSKRNTTRKYRKPHPDFPLTPHPAGQWCKKIRGRLHYFGRIEGDEDGQKGLAEYHRVKDDLFAGRPAGRSRDAISVGEICNRFLDFKFGSVKSGELAKETHTNLRLTCKRVVEALGKTRPAGTLGPDDFGRLRAALAARYGAEQLQVTISRVKHVFRWAEREGLLLAPPRYGAAFDPVPARVMRRERAAKGPRLFTPGQIHALLAACGPRERVVVLLGINAAFGLRDCVDLPENAMDLETGFLRFARGKTGIERTAWLWPETIEAIRRYLVSRPAAADREADRYLLRSRSGSRVKNSNALGRRFVDAMRAAGLDDAMTHYRLRHTFRAIADGTLDGPACDAVMGHVERSTGARYRGGCPNDRVRRVCAFVRDWLFGNGQEGGER